jgi:predicted GH43/DUF377 family glycosyl hydrolase
MFAVSRSNDNPILSPLREHPWETLGTFNPSPIATPEGLALFYRAASAPDALISPGQGRSVIGRSILDSEHHRFHTREQVVVPSESWDALSCEDPRVTFFEGTYYLSYTAVSAFNADGIKAALAVSKDGRVFDEKHLVTPFNAKALAIFPERIRGEVVAIVTAHTERTAEQPRATIGIARARDIHEFWDPSFWEEWHARLAENAIEDPRRNSNDHVEVGAVPLKTPEGWLLLYSYIQNYFTEQNRVFGIEALLLDLEDPRRIIGRTRGPFLVPEEFYELHGMVRNIVFPSGAYLRDDGMLDVYYGAADTTSAKASFFLEDLLSSIHPETKMQTLKRFAENPILSPVPEHPWESRAVFNTAAVDVGGSVHLLYRAMSQDNTSTLGYARLADARQVNERLSEPAYRPRASFEMKRGSSTSNSGCEDPRATIIDGRVYMTYTAYDGVSPPRVAITSIAVEDFLEKRFDSWDEPRIITPEGVDDKNMCLLSEKINGHYVLFHRIDRHICVDMLDNLSFSDGAGVGRCLELLAPRHGMWDEIKIGITAPPFRVPEGWLLLYHGVSCSRTYRFGAVLFDANIETIIGRTADPIFEPELPFEREGQIQNVVFSCGAVIRDDTLFLYYGGADTAIGGATASVRDIVTKLTRHVS